MKLCPNFPGSYKLPETGETLFFEPFNEDYLSDDNTRPLEKRILRGATVYTDNYVAGNHFGVIAENGLHKWTVGWNGIGQHFDHDSMESALRYWYLKWHEQERRG